MRANFYPGIYFGFKTGKLAVSAGFNPIGGGAGAKYEKGFPSFEMSVADLVPLLNSKNIPTTQYAADIFFEGSSVYFGFQANASYEINNIFSVAAGLRLVTAKNTYTGSLTNMSINPNYPAFGAAYNGSMVPATEFFTAGATTLNTLAAGSALYAAGLTPIVQAGYGSVLLSDGTTVGLTRSRSDDTQILGAAGYSTTNCSSTIASSQGTLVIAGPRLLRKGSMTGYAAANKTCM